MCRRRMLPCSLPKQSLVHRISHANHLTAEMISLPAVCFSCPACVIVQRIETALRIADAQLDLMRCREVLTPAEGDKKEEKVKGNPARRAAAAAEYLRLARSGAPPGTRYVSVVFSLNLDCFPLQSSQVLATFKEADAATLQLLPIGLGHRSKLGHAKAVGCKQKVPWPDAEMSYLQKLMETGIIVV